MITLYYIYPRQVPRLTWSKLAGENDYSSPGVGPAEVEGEQSGDSLGLQDAPDLHRQDALLQVWQATSQV